MREGCPASLVAYFLAMPDEAYAKFIEICYIQCPISQYLIRYSPNAVDSSRTFEQYEEKQTLRRSRRHTAFEMSLIYDI